jgi:hypothetical protein
MTVGSEEKGFTAIDEPQLLHVDRSLSEIGYGEYGVEYGLKPRVLSLIREHVHLEEAFIGVLLDFDQIGNLNRGLNLGKIFPFTGGIRSGICHFVHTPKMTIGRLAGGLRPASQRIVKTSGCST